MPDRPAERAERRTWLTTLRRGVPRVLGDVATIFERIDRWQRVANGRRQLLALDERMLHDLAITQADAAREAHRHFWDDAPRSRAPEG